MSLLCLCLRKHSTAILIALDRRGNVDKNMNDCVLIESFLITTIVNTRIIIRVDKITTYKI